MVRGRGVWPVPADRRSPPQGQRGQALWPIPVENAPARSHVQAIARTDPGRGRLRETSAPATPRARSRPMAFPHQHQPPVRNGLLAALPPEDLARLRPQPPARRTPLRPDALSGGRHRRGGAVPRERHGVPDRHAGRRRAGRGRDRRPGGPDRPAPRLRRRPLAGRGQGADWRARRSGWTRRPSATGWRRAPRCGGCCCATPWPSMRR